MCGIAGIIRFGPSVDRAEISAMTSSLSSRGPDDSGVWSEGNLALGHRRLAIIDLADGRQPMANIDGSIIITFNGEIYNFLEVRAVLEQKGHRFLTHSDTEVVLRAYEAWHEDCVHHLRGMFAFGIIDKRKRKLFLARDHFGIKPLVYYSDSDCFAFASEIRSLRKINGASFDLNLEAIDQYLWLQYIPPPQSIFRQVMKLPPACRLSVSFDGKVTGPEEYWRLGFEAQHDRSEEDWIEELDTVLLESVKSHLVSDVPYGAFLSGGLDSSAVVAYMARALPGPVKTFTIDFEEKEFSEFKYSESVAKRWRTEHHYELVRPDAIEILPDLVRHYGEPFGDKSALPTYYLCRMARKYVPMVLSGDGGDEAFAGYATYSSWLQWLSGSGPLWKKTVRPLAVQLFPERYHRCEPSLDAWLSFVSILPPHQRKRLWKSDFQKCISGMPPEVFQNEFVRTLNYSACKRVQHLDYKTYLPSAILSKVDIASMMHGLEVRTPLIDLRVVGLVSRLPESVCISRTDGEFSGKRILKKLLEKYYPSDFINRPKMGFDLPLRKWFSYDGKLRTTIEELLLGASSPLHDLFEKRAIQSLVEQNSTSSLWLLLFLDEWLRQNKAPVIAR